LVLLITSRIVREFLDYDPETGLMMWKRRKRYWFRTDGSFRTWNTRYAGKPAGFDHNAGYLDIAIYGRKYLAHRLIWLWMTGRWPSNQIDHWDGNRRNNKWDNLFDVTSQQNNRNRKIDRRNTSGVLGVTLRNNCYYVQIWANNKNHWLGPYASLVRAARVRKIMDAKYGFSPNHGRD
jgi:HNH endonuclease